MDRILNIQKSRQERQKTTYKRLLSNVRKRIEYYANSNNFECLYQVPVMTPGLPLYNKSEASQYIKKKLLKEGFKVLICENDILYISWKADDVIDSNMTNDYSEDIKKKRKKDMKKMKKKSKKYGSKLVNNFYDNTLSYLENKVNTFK